MKIGNKLRLIVALVLAAVLTLTVTVAVLAANDEPKEDATVAIEAAFSDKRVGETIKVANDGYIGIPVEVTNYYDFAAHGKAKSGYNGTVLVIYVVNTNTERIGSKSDTEIIQSMLDRGYIVSVLDYLNNSAAKSPALDWSTQSIRREFLAGSYLTDKNVFASGKYNDNFIVPAGYDLTYGHVFWEADKHGADGTLDKIVENWNTDFRGCFADTVIYWCDDGGQRKATQKAPDGSSPVWLNASGAADANGSYIAAKYTLAEDITDCVGKDGRPIDLNLYMHIVYPTTTAENPLENVPVIALANSSEYLSTASTSSGLRPQHNGFLFRGYAGAVFDYLYQPMAQSDYYGYYDGRTDIGGMTGDRMNYGLHLYDDKRVNTAAVRYMRYLAYTQPETYAFDTESIGVYGNSKGGWFTFLGEAELRNYTVDDASKYTVEQLETLIDTRINNYTSKRQYAGHDNETRYQNGITEAYVRNGITIDGGELQPWLTYTDKNGEVHEILSYINWAYASNGSNSEDITAGHCPVFCALHMQDDFTVTNNEFSEVTANLDIPSIFVIVDLGHTFAYGPEYHYGYDTYDAMFSFANYYLRGDAVEVIYTSPKNKTGNIALDQELVIKFSGSVPASEIEKIAVISSLGVKATGTWTSARGETEWTFHPTSFVGSETYSVTVPASLCGDNGKAMGADYTYVVRTVDETLKGGNTVNGTKGTYLVFNTTDMSDTDSARVRFYVANDAANTVALYAVNSYNASAPDSSEIGDLVGKVSLTGSGYYEIDATEYIAAANGGSAVFLLKATKEADSAEKVIDIASSLSGVSVGSFIKSEAAVTAPDGSAASSFYATTNVYSSGSKQYPAELDFYANTTTLMSVSGIFSTSNITEDDLGRLYTVTLRVYDTVSRTVRMYLNGAFTSTNGVHDYNRVSYNLKTKANEWTELTFTYRVYEPDYGDKALAKKNLTVTLEPDGNKNSKIYVDSITVTETTTDVSVTNAAIISGNRGGAYKASDATPFSIGGAGYKTLYAALSAAANGDTVVMNANYTTTAQDNFTLLSGYSALTIDLNGYDLHAKGGSPIVASAKSNADTVTNITLKGGDVYLYSDALVTLAGTTSAGAGKKFNINIENVNILNVKGSRLEYVMLDCSTANTYDVSVNFTVKNSNVEFLKSINTNNPVTVFSNGTGKVNVSYKLSGGRITCDLLDGVTLWTAFKKTEFVESNGTYTTLVLPESEGVPGMAIMREDGVAAFERDKTENYISTLVAAKSELSTKYGLIPEAYADANTHPFVVFDENGGFINVAGSWLGTNGTGGALGVAKNYVNNAWNGTTYGDNPKEAYIVMRRNYTFTSGEYFDNLAQTQGTIYVDLGGYTLSAGTVTKTLLPATSKGFSGAAGEKMFPTTVIVSNGKMIAYNQGIMQFQCWDSVGGGAIANKKFSFIFNNVTFGVHSTGVNAASLLTHMLAQKTTTAAAPYYVEYNDCTFDVKTATSANAMRLFVSNSDGRYVKITTVVNGGKIIANDPAKVIPVYGTGDAYGSSVTFGKDSAGNYLTFVVPEDKTVAGGEYHSEEGVLYFERGAVENGEVTYNLTKNPNATEYGTIPPEYADAETYPFVVFDENGGFLGAYKWLCGANTSSSAMDKARSYMQTNVYNAADKTYGANPKSVTILQRRDYTAIADERLVNIAQIQGSVLFDLGGYTYTQNSAAKYPIFYVTSKGWSGSGDEKMFPTTISVKNGQMLVTGQGVIGFNTWESVGNGAIAHKVFTFNFDNVDFGFASGATSANLLAYYNNTGGGTFTVPGPLNVNCTDCNFDMRTNASSADNVTIFNAACASGQWVKATFRISGGSIIADSLDGITVAQIESKYGSSVTFTRNGGAYTTLQLSSGASVPTTQFVTDSGNKSFVKSEVNGDVATYVLSSLTTEYGTIPEQYASVLDYPFVVFNSKGEFVAACTAFYGKQSGSSAIGKAIYTVLKPNVWDTAAGSYGSGETNAIILMRRDYTLGVDEYHDNLAQAQGKVIIDLGGFTLSENPSNTKGRSIFLGVNKRWSDSGDAHIFPTTYNIKNGTILMHKYSLMSMESWKSSTAGTTVADKHFTWQFDGVTFGLQAGATTAELIGRYTVHNSNTKEQVAPFHLIFNNCIFDLRTNAPHHTVNIFNCNVEAKHLISSDITVNGGKVLANDMSYFTVYTFNNANGSSITFSEDFAIELKDSAAAPADTVEYPLASGSGTLAAAYTEGGYTTYKIVKSIITEYGSIPAKYADVEKYPFVVFRNGQFVFATNIFGLDAKDSALHRAKSNGSVILLRRDFDYNESQYNNLSQTNGTITIDLGGYTIRCVQSGANAFLFAQKKTTYNSGISIKNGTILTAKNPIVKFSCWSGSSGGAYLGGAYFNISFTDVTLGAVPGTSPEVLIADVVQGLAEPTTSANLTLTNCVIDLSGIEDSIIFNLQDQAGVVITEAKIVGGKIIADQLSGITLYTITDEKGSAFLAEKYNGKYTTITLPEGEYAPSFTLTSAYGNELSFVKTGNEGGYDVYTLAAKELSDIKVYTSVTLYSDFTINTYLTVSDSITAVTVNGKTVDLSTAERVTYDGKECYVIRTKVAASDAAEDHLLSVTSNGNGTGVWAINIVRYAERIINGSFTETEKTLMRDILSYIKAVYAYFAGKGTVDAAKLASANALIDSVLGEGYTARVPATLAGTEAKKSTEGLTEATVYLGSEIAFAFKVAEGVSDVKFFSNGVELFSEVRGEYVYVTTYAYGITSDISYTATKGGVQIGGTYNLKSYYDYAVSLDGAESALTDLLASLWSYSESAAAYRNAVNGN